MCVRDDVCYTVGNPEKHEWLRTKKQCSTEDNNYCQVLEDSVGQDSRESEKIADSHIVFKAMAKINLRPYCIVSE